MEQRTGSVISIVLLLLSVTGANAKNLIFVNATGSAIDVTTYFKLDTTAPAKSCALSYQTIQPGQMYSKDIAGCLAKQIVVDVKGQGNSIRVDVDPSQRIDRGVFVIMPDGANYKMVGPLVGDTAPDRKMYLINATPHHISATYARGSLFDINDPCVRDFELPPFTMEESYTQGCLITALWTANAYVESPVARFTGIEEGVFVFTKTNTEYGFTVAGPLTGI